MRLTIPSILATSLLLSACGGGDSAIDGAKDIPNRFGNTQNALDDFSSGSTGDSSNARGLEPNQVRVTMELPVNLAPEGEQTRRNLRIVIPDQVRVYRTNTSAQKFDDVRYSTEKGTDGHFILTFDNGVPVGPDVIIEARYGTATMTALAADADRDVKVNPFSHYLVSEVLWSRYSTNDFQTVLACVDNASCLNKYVWGTLADQVHDFEIDIPENANVTQATSTLADRADFASYVADMADYALLGQAFSDRISASAADYNSVFLGLELGQTFRESNVAGAGQWGVRMAQVERLTEDNRAFLYPALTLTSFDAFNLNITSLATDIPYDRQTQIHGFFERNNSGIPEQLFFERGTETWERNSHSSAPGAATLTTETPARLLAGRALYQTITKRNSSLINGWTRNPYYLDAFTSEPVSDQSGPDRVLTNYFTGGKAIALEDDNGKLKRRNTLENHYLSVFELHLQRAEEFKVSDMAGQAYNVAYLATRFADGAPATFETGHGQWAFGSANDQTLNGTANVDQFTLGRDASGGVATPDTSNDTWNLINRRSRLSSGDIYMGRLGLFRNEIDERTNFNDPNFGNPDMGLGAATPNQELMAFNLNDGTLGSGLLVAGKTLTNGALTEGAYRLQGAIVGVTQEENRLYHVNNARLTLANSSASFEGVTMMVNHLIEDNEVEAPEELPMQFNGSFTTTSEGGISITGAGEYEMHGFYTGAGNQIFLVISDSTGPEMKTGLLLATLIEESPEP
ncbi:hypothetical protein [Marinobacter sp. tcs-11]|uniref:hypothetical protein n=1 Tax=Marinobacter sp. tcs-11 TaxID=1742860 RepID=UPI00257C011C|nr:hypothetical protein [Marinobacter sp. tcs-11]